MRIDLLAVANAELRDCPHLPRHPRCEDLPPLLLAESRSGEVTSSDKDDNVDDQLMTAEDGIDDDRHDRCQICLPYHLDQDDDETASLEYSPIRNQHVSRCTQPVPKGVCMTHEPPGTMFR